MVPSTAISNDDVDLQGLLDGRLVLVTGKGGTGKTSVALALSYLAAARGRSVLLCEVDMARSALTDLVEVVPGIEPAAIDGDVSIANVRWPETLHRFLQTLVPSRRIVNMVLDNAAVHRFIDFTPGSREMVSLSCIADLTERFDLVVVDMPASGHALSLLDITRSALGLFRSGPIRRRATELRRLLLSRDTGVVFVALPEEMVVNETVETVGRMRAVELLSRDPVVVLNRATLPSLHPEERALLDALGGLPLDDHQRELVRAGRWEALLEEATDTSLTRLRAELGVEPTMVPPVAPGADAIGIAREVAVVLGRSMGITRRELPWA